MASHRSKSSYTGHTARHDVTQSEASRVDRNKDAHGEGVVNSSENARVRRRLQHKTDALNPDHHQTPHLRRGMTEQAGSPMPRAPDMVCVKPAVLTV
jgi:hypothetical protein